MIIVELDSGEWEMEAAEGRRPLGLEEAHALGWVAPGEVPGKPFDAALMVRAMYVRAWWAEQVERARPSERRARGPTHDGQADVLGPREWGSSCRDRPPVVALRLVPPLHVVLVNRARMIAAFLGVWAWWALRHRLVQGRSPFARAVAVPTIGRRGVWTRPAPSAFGCEGDRLAVMAAPFGRGWTCVAGDGPLPVRPMARPVSMGTTPAWEAGEALVVIDTRLRAATGA